MILHYLKMAFRSLGKYRMQNIISIVSLAVALFCFSLNMYFSRYLLTIDKWKDNQVVYLETVNKSSWVNPKIAGNFAMQIPGVKSLLRCHTMSQAWKEVDDPSPLAALRRSTFIGADTTVVDVLGLDILAGNWQSATSTASKYSLVLTESFAKQEYGSISDAIGHEIVVEGLGYGPMTVQAVIQDLPYANSIAEFKPVAGWIICKDYDFKSSGPAMVRLKDGVDPDDFIKSLYREELYSNGEKVKNYIFREDDDTIGASKKPGNMDFTERFLSTILISLPGIIILLVALFNYFHLLVNSILTSKRDYALRRVHGARTIDMWLMVSTQIILTTILTGILSMIIARYVTPFIVVGSLTETRFCMETGVILNHTLQYIALLILAGLLIAWIAVNRVRRAEMSKMIKHRYGGRNIMMGIQLTVAQLTITLLVAMFLKMRANLTEPYSWLSKEDKTCIITDRTLYYDKNDMEPEISYLKSLPYITHVVNMFVEHLGEGNTLITEYTTGGYDDKMNCCRVIITPEILDMLKVTIMDGRMPEKSNEILVDDEFIGRFGLNVGDTIRVRDLFRNYPDLGYDEYNTNSGWVPLVITGHIDNINDKGNIRNMGSHTPSIYCNWEILSGYVVVKCLPGYQKETKEAIAKYHYPDKGDDENMGDYYSSSIYDYMNQNNNVWNSIGFIAWTVAIIAFIITLLGVYSAISIDTARRRREMAVRKINGAKTSQITMQFANLYVKLFIVSTVVSIPLSAFIIKHVILNGQLYDKGAGYAIMFYLFILAVMVVFVSLTIGFKIYGIARENPADVIKSE